MLFVFGSSISLALVDAVLFPCFLVKGRARRGVSKNIRLDTMGHSWGVQQTMHSMIREAVQILMLCLQVFFCVGQVVF